VDAPLKNLVRAGASPRGTINLALTARALAFMRGRAFVTPQDVKDMAHDVLRHRILLTYEAEAEEMTTDTIIERILARCRCPSLSNPQDKKFIPPETPMLTDEQIEEMMARVRKLELKARRLVRESFSGEYLSSFRGQGLDFDDFREYQHGDEVRFIDWNVTARMNQPYVRKFREERELR
jgi:hypothetical protein